MSRRFVTACQKASLPQRLIQLVFVRLTWLQLAIRRPRSLKAQSLPVQKISVRGEHSAGRSYSSDSTSAKCSRNAARNAPNV